MSEWDNQYYEDEGDGYGTEPYCITCGGRRWRVTCIDDLCYGEEECIHGDPPTPCPDCNPKGELEDALFS